MLIGISSELLAFCQMLKLVFFFWNYSHQFFNFRFCPLLPFIFMSESGWQGLMRLDHADKGPWGACEVAWLKWPSCNLRLSPKGLIFLIKKGKEKCPLQKKKKKIAKHYLGQSTFIKDSLSDAICISLRGFKSKAFVFPQGLFESWTKSILSIIINRSSTQEFQAKVKSIFLRSR